MTQVSYGEITRDLTKIPQASLIALAQRGFQHLLGNEQASRVVGKIRGEVVNGTDRKAETVTSDEVRAFRASKADQVAQWMREAVESALKALDEGTIGQRIGGGGPKANPVVAAMQSLARQEVSVTLKANGVKTPKGDETVQLGKDLLTMAQLIDRRLAKHGDRLRKDAERQVAETARRRDKAIKAAQEAKSAGGEGAESLGL